MSDRPAASDISPTPHHSVRRRLILFLLAAVALVMLFDLAISQLIQKRALTEEQRLRAVNIVERLAFTMSQPMWDYDEEHLKELALQELKDREVMAVLLTLDNGRPYVGKSRSQRGDDAVIDAPPGTGNQREPGQFSISRDILRHGQTIAKVTVILGDAPIRQRLQQQLIQDLLQMLFVLGAISALTYLGLSRLILRPLSELYQTTRAFGQGDLSMRARISSDDEIAALGETLNLMAERLSATIAATRAAANEVTELNSRLNNIIEFVPDAMFVVDHEGRVIAWNHAIEEMTGVRKEQMLGQGNMAYAIPFFGERRPILIDLLDLTGSEIEQYYTHVQRIGDKIIAETYVGSLHGEREAYLWGIAAPLYDQAGQRSGAIEVIRDITERRQAEKALSESEERYSLITRNVTDVIWTMDPAYRFTYVNPAVERIHGWSVEEFLQLSLQDIMPPHSLAKTVAVIQEEQKWHESPYAERNRTRTLELEERRKDGSSFWAEVSATFLWTDDGALSGFIGVTRDITERRQLEQQVIQQQKLEGIGMLAGGIAHDINNLLTPIFISTEMALRKIEPEHPAHARITAISQAATRVKDLVAQLLVFGRKQKAVLQPLDLNAVVTEFMGILRRTIRENIDIVLMPGSESCMVQADRNQLEQVIMNLAVNAQDAIDGVGTITVETGHLTLDGEYCAYHPETTPGRYVMLAFADTGCGMDDQTRSKAFEPFFTTKPAGKGTGLGLSTVYGIIRQHGGHVDVLSRTGHGSTFRVFLPIAESAAHGNHASLALAEPVTSFSGTLLVVEDNDMLRDSLVEALRESGITTRAAASAREALDVITSRGSDITLLLTDVVMPVMNGPELYHAIRDIKPELPALFMSGYASDISQYHEIADNPEIFLSKPFTIQTLLRKIQQLQQPNL